MWYGHLWPLAALYFSTLSRKMIYFRKNVIEHKFVVSFSLQLLSNTFLILRKTERDMIKMYIGLQVKYRYSCQLLTKLGFLTDFQQILKYKIS